MMARTAATLLVTVLLHCCHVDSFWMTYKADITPTDALVFVGETLGVQCQLNLDTSDTSPSDMYFEIEPTINDTWKIPQQATIVGSNNITTELVITDRYSHYTTVYCKDKSKNDLLLRSAAIFVEYPIKNITDFTGILYYDNSTIIFTWSLGQTYLDLTAIKVDVDWNPFTAPGSKGNNCTIVNQEFCTIPWLSQKSIFIRITVSHIRSDNRKQKQILVPLYETSATSVHEFFPYDNLKTGPADSLKVENVTNTCVSISWKDSLYLNSNIFINTTYRIEVRTDDEPEFKVVVDQAERLNSSDIVTVCQLTPFTKYSLSVQLRAFDSNPWSERAIVGFQTEEDRPLTGPPVTDTSYRVGECVDSKREVFVYWNDPSKQSLQGHLTRFEVVSNNDSKKLLRAAYNYYTDSLDCDVASEILVYSATKVGPSIIPSQMYIPKESDELTFEKDLMFRVEEKSTVSDSRSTINVTVKWNPGDNAGNISLIVYMCAETYVPNTCFNDFQTIEINLSKKEIQLNDIPSTTNLFGYAVKDDKGLKGGIHWSSCVYSTDTIPDKPSGLHVIPGSRANSLEISWTSTQCNKSKKVLILHYYLLICKQRIEESVNGSCLNITISDLSINNYTAKNLQGGRPYYVYIQAESLAGLGYLSDVKVGIPDFSSSDTGRILAITMGTILTVLLVGLLLCCFARLCVKSSSKVKQMAKTNPVKLPESETTVARQNSDDSGNCSGSYQNSSNESRPIPPSRCPVNVDSLQQSTCTQSSTVSSVVGISGVHGGAGVTIHTHVAAQALGESESSAPYMQIGNTQLLHYVSQPAVVDPVQLGTSTESSSVAEGAVVSAGAACTGANADVRSAQDADDTSSSIPYTQFMNTSFLNHMSQTDFVPNVVLEDIPNDSSNNSFPTLQTSHLPPVIQPDCPLQEIMVIITDQIHEQTAPKGEDNSQTTDYVSCTTDENIDSLTEHCRPETGSVVPQGMVLPVNCQTVPGGRNQGQNTAWSSGQESEIRKNRTDSIVPQELLCLSDYQVGHNGQGQNAVCSGSQENCLSINGTYLAAPQQSLQLSNYKAIPDRSKQGQSAASSDVLDNLLSSSHKIDHQHSVDADGYIRQDGAGGKDIGENDYKQFGEATHHCLREETDSGDNTFVLSSGGDLSFNGSSCSLVWKDFNIDDLINNEFLNGDHRFNNLQNENNSLVRTDEHLEVLNGVNQDMSSGFRDDADSQDITSGFRNTFGFRNDADGQDKTSGFRSGADSQDSVNVSRAPEVSTSDHQGGSAGYNAEASLHASQNDPCEDEDWCYEHNGEASQDELDYARLEQRALSVANSGYKLLSSLEISSSSEDSDVSPHSSNS